MPERKLLKIPDYTLGEELGNSISHGVGALLAVAALVLCIIASLRSGDPWAAFSGSVYGVTLIMLYTMSCLYHALVTGSAKRVFRVLDHCGIFLLIAGTYTPYTLVTLRETPVGWPLFAVIWAAAIVGIVLNAIDLEKFKLVSMLCYLAMGWCIVFAVRPLMENLAAPGLVLLLAGGLAYTLGAILYGLGAKRKYFHSVWHLFVLAGSALHFFSILFYVL
ncbi:MAG: hemolysin III family protein [Oscillospiraceae bacterium]|jgi:hemolysin III|nr:hemolysin III family protein [Oscillospiraceae bacterium]